MRLFSAKPWTVLNFLERLALLIEDCLGVVEIREEVALVRSRRMLPTAGGFDRELEIEAWGL